MDGKSKVCKTNLVLMALFFCIAAALTAALSVPAEADIYRGCQGTFAVNVVRGDGMPISNSGKTIDAFEGRGQCRNSTQANTCRHRAMDNIFRCANDLWAMRWNLIGDPNDSNWDGGLPLSCQGRATGAKGVGPFYENPFGQFFDIKYEIERTACCELQPSAGTLQLSVVVSSTGDKGCGKNKTALGGYYSESRTLENNYVADCKRLRAQGMCAVRRN